MNSDIIVLKEMVKRVRMTLFALFYCLSYAYQHETNLKARHFCLKSHR